MLSLRHLDRHESDLSDADGARLFGELEAMEAERVEVIGNGPAVVTVTDDNVRSIARALDHLRNEGGATRELHDARDAVLMRARFAPLTYRLLSWEFDGREVGFFSYTGPYVDGQRLVHGTEGSLRVVSVERQATTIKDGVLVVEKVKH